MLSKQYPTVQSASTEIINLRAILNLPKGTEHFISDVHGEYEAFQHILNSASGVVVREKIDELFANSVPKAERDQLATFWYTTPGKNWRKLSGTPQICGSGFCITFHRLIDLCCLVSAQYTRSKVRKAMPQEYGYIIEELIHTHYEYSGSQ